MMLLCWDACIFIDWLKDEGDASYLSGINDMIQQFESEKCQIMLSAVAVAEIWPKPGVYLPNKFAQYEQMLGNSLMVHPMDMRVAKKTAEIRDALEPKVKLPDAAHIATAILFGADYLCTNDGDILTHAQNIWEMSGDKTKVVKPPLPKPQHSLPL